MIPRASNLMQSAHLAAKVLAIFPFSFVGVYPTSPAYYFIEYGINYNFVYLEN